MDRYDLIRTAPSPYCACGCGQHVRYSPFKKDWNIYVGRHSIKSAEKRSRGGRKVKKHIPTKRRDPSKAPLCACGCGQHVTTYNVPLRKWNKYIKSHRYANTKSNLSKAPLCKCGCGQRTKYNSDKRRFAEFIYGHASRLRPLVRRHPSLAPLCACGCGQKTKWDSVSQQFGEYLKSHRILKYPQPDYTNVPLCACGCGAKVSWDWGKHCWRRYVLSHFVKSEPSIYLAALLKTQTPSTRKCSIMGFRAAAAKKGIPYEIQNEMLASTGVPFNMYDDEPLYKSYEEDSPHKKVAFVSIGRSVLKGIFPNGFR